MCGIAGIISQDKEKVTLQRLKLMTDALAHRGPDGESAWIDETGETGFGHRRLCIIDLSPAGAQPMHYLDRYTIIHNGEIYNYVELREILQAKGYSFRSASDTEVILAAFDCWKEDCVQQFEGMFAFAIWDKATQLLYAARDRFGEKPFYFSRHDNGFLFASEMKALWAAGVPREMQNEMLLYYLALGYSSPPPGSDHDCFYKFIQTLKPSHWLRFDVKNNHVDTQKYYSIDPRHINENISEQTAVESFRQKFTESISRRLRTDVPLGTCLSGGLDSSSIAALLQGNKSSQTTMKTFSATFPGFEKNESGFIDLMSKEKQLENYQVHPTADDFIATFQKLLYHQEEPFGSASIYAQYKVFELAVQQNVTVLLDGQGADEILAGYHKYIHWYLQELFAARQLSTLLKEKNALNRNGIPFRWGIKHYASAIFPATAASKLRDKKVIQVLHHPDITDEFKKANLNGAQLSLNSRKTLNDVLLQSVFANGLEELLRYADRNSMAHGREVRLPFLDHHLAEFVFSLPSTFKIHNGWTKWLLRKAMDKDLPAAITWRKDKIGFEPPQQQWMEDPRVQEYVQESKRVLVQKGILRQTVLNKKVQPKAAHVADNFDWRYLIAGSLLR